MQYVGSYYNIMLEASHEMIMRGKVFPDILQ